MKVQVKWITNAEEIELVEEQNDIIGDIYPIPKPKHVWVEALINPNCINRAYIDLDGNIITSYTDHTQDTIKYSKEIWERIEKEIN